MTSSGPGVYWYGHRVSQSKTSPERKAPKVKASKEDDARVTMTVDRRTAMKLDKEIAEVRLRYPGVNPTRSSVAKALVARSLLRRASTKEERAEARTAILKEASILKLQAMNKSVQGDGEYARQFHLLAAARELEALAVMKSPDDRTVLSALIEVVGELKAATGYRSLPDVPRKR